MTTTPLLPLTPGLYRTRHGRTVELNAEWFDGLDGSWLGIVTNSGRRWKWLANGECVNGNPAWDLVARVEEQG